MVQKIRKEEILIMNSKEHQEILESIIDNLKNIRKSNNQLAFYVFILAIIVIFK